MGRLPLLLVPPNTYRGDRKVEQSEVKSDNARNVILSYNDKIYYVSGVNVAVKDGVDKLKAIFHAKRASDNGVEDLDIEINQGTYDILMEYAKLDKLDLIMVLQIEGSAAKWCLMSEDWLKNQYQPVGSKGYIV
jgi:hypothetical protein